MESLESHDAGFPPFPHSLEIPSGFPHSHGLGGWIYVFSCPLDPNHSHRKGLVTDVSGPQRNVCPGTLTSQPLAPAPRNGFAGVCADAFAPASVYGHATACLLSSSAAGFLCLPSARACCSNTQPRGSDQTPHIPARIRSGSPPAWLLPATAAATAALATHVSPPYRHASSAPSPTASPAVS